MGGRGCKTFENGIHLSSISYPLSFHILAHSFALVKIITLFFSSACSLFDKNNQGRGGLNSSLEYASWQAWGRGSLGPSVEPRPLLCGVPSSSQRKGAPQASPRLSQPTSTER